MKTKRIIAITFATIMAVAACSVTAFAAYFEWEYTGTTTVQSTTGALLWKETIGKQELKSYVYENLTDQKAARAIADHYTYNKSSNTYTYGWKNSSECYSRARIESASGAVYSDSQRKYAQYTSTAESPDLFIGIAKTYCGNDAAN